MVESRRSGTSFERLKTDVTELEAVFFEPHALRKASNCNSFALMENIERQAETQAVCN
jgi:hypothetical protein